MNYQQGSRYPLYQDEAQPRPDQAPFLDTVFVAQDGQNTVETASGDRRNWLPWVAGIATVALVYGVGSHYIGEEEKAQTAPTSLTDKTHAGPKKHHQQKPHNNSASPTAAASPTDTPTEPAFQASATDCPQVAVIHAELTTPTEWKVRLNHHTHRLQKTDGNAFPSVFKGDFSLNSCIVDPTTVQETAGGYNLDVSRLGYMLDTNSAISGVQTYETKIFLRKLREIDPGANKVDVENVTRRISRAVTKIKQNNLEVFKSGLVAYAPQIESFAVQAAIRQLQDQMRAKCIDPEKTTVTPVNTGTLLPIMKAAPSITDSKRFNFKAGETQAVYQILPPVQAQPAPQENPACQ